MLNNTVCVCVCSKCWNGKYHRIIVFCWHKRCKRGELFGRFCSDFHRLELAILTIQKKEPKVFVVYDLLNLIWKTYHFSGKSKRELYVFGQELGVDICTPSSVKATRWVPHIHRALKVLLRHGQDKDLAADEGQYSVGRQHMEQLAAASTTAGSSRAKKVSFTQEM